MQEMLEDREFMTAVGNSLADVLEEGEARELEGLTSEPITFDELLEGLRSNDFEIDISVLLGVWVKVKGVSIYIAGEVGSKLSHYSGTLLSYPEFVGIVRDEDSMNRVFNQLVLDRRSPEHRNVRTYGLFAPQLREGIDRLLDGNKLGTLLIGGVLSPYTVQEVLALTEIYSPEKIVIADRASSVFEMCKIHEVEGFTPVVCDFLDPRDMIPEYDIAIMQDNVSAAITGGQYEMAQKMVQSVALKKRRSDFGGLVYVEGGDIQPLVNGLQESLSEIDLDIVEMGTASSCFLERPDFDTLRGEYDPALIGIKRNMSYMVIGGHGGF